MYSIKRINTVLRFKLVSFAIPTAILLGGCGAGEGLLVGTTAPSDPEPAVSSTSTPIQNSSQQQAQNSSQQQAVLAATTAPEEPSTGQKPYVYILNAHSSDQDRSYGAENTLDGSADGDSRWSAEPTLEKPVKPWIEYELSEPVNIEQISIHFFRSDTRNTLFDVLVSKDGEEWITVLKDAQSAIIPHPITEYDPAQTFTLDPAGKVSFLRIVGYGNSQPENNWTSIREVYIPSVTNDPALQMEPTPPADTDPVVTANLQVDEDDNTVSQDVPATGGFVVSDAAELNAALDQAVAGEVIVLKDGNYGELVLRNRLYGEEYVVIRSENPHGAEFSKISSTYNNSGYIHFDRIKASLVDIDGHPTQGSPHHLKFTNSWFTGSVSFREISDLVLDHNVIDVDGGYHALLIDEVVDVVVTKNFIARAQEDLMRISGETNRALVENNVFYDAMPKNTPAEGAPCRYNHSDALQTFGHSPPRKSGSPTNLTIRGNLFYDDPSNNDIKFENCGNFRIYMQGIFISDPRPGGYKNITIDNNLLYIGSPNAVVMNGATENVVISNNTILPWPGGGGGSIRIRETGNIPNTDLLIENNITTSVSPGAEVSNPSKIMSKAINNFIYARKDESSPIYYAKLFQGRGDGSRWQDFLPTPGSPVDFRANIGAVDLLQSLLDGEMTVPNDPVN